MSEFYTILTDIGLQKHNDCVLNGKKFLETTTCHIGIGDGNGISYNPVSSQTALANEVLSPRLQIGGVSYDESTGICVKAVLPIESGGFWVREIGVFDADGDLVIIVKQAPTYKPSLGQGAIKDILVKVHSKDVNASVVTLGIDASFEFLAISGGKMQGDIDMDNNEISNLPHYTDPQAHKALFDAIPLPNYNTPNSINIGRCDTNGNANIVSASGNTIKLYATTATTLGITNHLRQDATFAQTLYKTIPVINTNVGSAISGGDYSGKSGSYAFDGSVTTCWGSSQLGSANILGISYLGKNFGSPKEIKSVSLYQGYVGSLANFCDSVKVRKSNDGVTWTDVKTFTGLKNLAWNYLYLDTPITTQYISVMAVSGFSGNTSNNWCIQELSFNTAPYNIFLGVDGVLDAFNTPLTYAKTLPLVPVANEVCYLIGKEPSTGHKRNLDNTTWENYSKVPCGQAITNSSGIVSSVVQPELNQNNYNVNANSTSANAGNIATKDIVAANAGNIITKDIVTNRVMPDYASTISTGGTYTATKDGIWSVTCSNDGNHPIYIYVNGVGRYTINGYGTWTGGVFLISKGDTISVDSNFVAAGFIPLKGAL